MMACHFPFGQSTVTILKYSFSEREKNRRQLTEFGLARLSMLAGMLGGWIFAVSLKG
jgi:hypothetical protein